MSLELVDMIAVYPDQEDPQIQKLISAKREFSELASQSSEPVPAKGELYKHQKLIQRFMRAYDRLLLFHGVGTGKSSSFIGVSEYYKTVSTALYKSYLDAIHTNAEIKRVYVLVRGPALMAEFKRELVYKATPGTYINKTARKTASLKVKRREITREVNQWYTIESYRTFARRIKDFNDQRLKEEFSDCIFFVDEVHNLRNDPRAKEGDELKAYNVLEHLFNIIERSKVIVASATPMINDTREIISVMNLILPPGNKIPWNEDMDSITLEQAKRYFNGLVSYIRELETGAVSVLQGKKIQATYELDGKIYNSQSIIYQSVMSDFQQEWYLRYADETGFYRRNRDEQILEAPQGAEEQDVNVPQEETRIDFRKNERQACNFVFPDGSVGGTFTRGRDVRNPVGLPKFVKSDRANEYIMTRDFRDRLADPDQFRTMSSKFYSIVNLVKTGLGNCFCYSEFLTGCGAILLGMCFEANGFERFVGSRSVFPLQSRDSPKQDLEGQLEEEFIALEENIETKGGIIIDKKLRYALLTSETPGPEIQSILELFNSKENMHGEYLKVIIGSPVAREGINLANVQQVHLVSAGWNQSGMYQALGRALRSTSHVMLLEERRRQLLDQGLDPNQATVAVSIYKHAAVTNRDVYKDIRELGLNLNIQAGTSVDLEMYQLSEIKDIRIKRVERMMKQCAVDCQIQYQRNVRDTDQNGSPACDYQECKYKCINLPPLEEDDSTYDVYYSDEQVEELIPLLRWYFSQTQSSTYQEVASYFNIPYKYIVMAIEQMKRLRLSVTNSLGYICYINEAGDRLYLQREYPLHFLDPDAPSLSYYVANVPAVEDRSLEKTTISLKGEGETAILGSVYNINPSEIPDFIENLEVESRVALGETSLLKRVTGEDNAIDREILNFFNQFIFETREPTTALEKIKEPRKGRAPSTVLSEALKRQLDIKPEGDQVFIHNIYSQALGRTAYGATSEYISGGGRFRIYKPSEGVGWRDLTQNERLIYASMIQDIIQEKLRRFEEHPIYGTVLADKKFRIVDHSVAKKKETARSKNRGRICDTWKVPELMLLMQKLDIPEPDVGAFPDRQTIINQLASEGFNEEYSASTLPLRTLQYVYSWYKVGRTRDDLCQLVRDELEARGLLLVI